MEEPLPNLPPPLPVSTLPPKPILAQIVPPPARPTRQSFLAWWGIFPLVGLIAIEVTFGWQDAQANATLPQYALSYLAGRITAGALAATLLAYVVYRFGSRSSLAGTLTFTVIVGWICMTTMSNAILHHQSHPITQGPSPGPQLKTYAAFQIEIPPGWTEVRPDTESTVAEFLAGGDTWTNAAGMMKIDVGRPAHPTAGDVAKSFAGKDGHVDPAPVLIDGVEGVRVETPSNDMSRPRFAVAVFRRGQLYLIMAASANRTDVSAAFEHVLKSWRWKDAPQ